MNTHIFSFPNATRAAPMSLYGQALGPLFHRLSPVLARFHGPGDRRLIGALRVRPGTRPLVRLLLWAARMPRTNDKLLCHVFLAAWDGVERWQRLMGDHSMVSYQRQGNDHEIIERVGPLAIHLQTRVRNGGLWQRSTRTTVFGLPLPTLFGIRIVARERPIDARTFYCDVRMRSPLFGCLLQYSGILRFKD